MQCGVGWRALLQDSRASIYVAVCLISWDLVHSGDDETGAACRPFHRAVRRDGVSSRPRRDDVHGSTTLMHPPLLVPLVS
jgi:hypothetical protein